MPGGMELAMSQVISGLSGYGMKHSIACLKGEPEIADRLPQGTKIYCFHSRPNEPKLPLRLAKLIKTIKPDLIHARNWGAWPDIALARFMGWPPVPMIYSFHGLGKAGYMPWRRRAASRILVRITTRLFTVSRQSARMLEHFWGWPEKKTHIIPNGVDTEKFFPRPVQKKDRLVIGSVGNLRSVKNHSLILRACSKIAQKGFCFEIWIAGEGNQREALEKEAKDLGIEKNVFMPGRIDDIPTFLNRLDIFILSSDSEQHPNALNEAMACGIASIATRVGCVDDLMDHGNCGRIINVGDVQGLEKAILEYAENPGIRARMACAGLNHVRNNYSLQVMVRRYRALYLRTANK